MSPHIVNHLEMGCPVTSRNIPVVTWEISIMIIKSVIGSIENIIPIRKQVVVPVFTYWVGGWRALFLYEKAYVRKELAACTRLNIGVPLKGKDSGPCFDALPDSKELYQYDTGE